MLCLLINHISNIIFCTVNIFHIWVIIRLLGSVYLSAWKISYMVFGITERAPSPALCCWMFFNLVFKPVFLDSCVCFYRQPESGRWRRRRWWTGEKVCSSAAALWQQRRRERATAALWVWCWLAARGPAPAWALWCSGTADTPALHWNTKQKKHITHIIFTLCSPVGGRLL